MPSSGIELATLRSLALRSNQLSYAAAKFRFRLLILSRRNVNRMPTALSRWHTA